VLFRSNKDSFAKLPPAGQAYIKANFDQIVLDAGDIWEKTHIEVHNLVLNNPKITNDVLSDAEKAKMDAKLAPIIAQWVKDKEAKGLPAKQVVTDLFSTLESLGVKNPFVIPQ
jgi:TRAP-type C4-dicarboxylate transport system substrate-binding protein